MNRSFSISIGKITASHYTLGISLFHFRQAIVALEIKDRIKKKDVEGTIKLINTAPNALAWKDPKHYNSTLFHHAAWRNAAGLITATLKVFKISNELTHYTFQKTTF